MPRISDSQGNEAKLNTDGSINAKLVGSLAKPQATITRPADTTAYTAGDVVGQSPATNLTFANVLSTAGAQFIIAGVTLEIDVATLPSGMGTFRLHLFDSAPTAIADNAVFSIVDADRLKYLGFIEIDTPVDVGATILWLQVFNANLAGKLATGSTTLYGQLETRAAYTPTASAVKKVTIHPLGV